MENKTVGIAGGGQLARMLVLKAHEMGIPTVVLSAASNDPAAEVCTRHIRGNPKSAAYLKKLKENCDILTFESEFIDPINVGSTRGNIRAYPKLDHISKIRDRIQQKKMIASADLPTSPHLPVLSEKDFDRAIDQLGLPIVLKKNLFGYDGYGTFILKNKKQVEDFINGPDFQNNFIAEKFIPFKRELAFSMARNPQGEFSTLPLVETHQEQARCLWVKGPIQLKAAEGLKSKCKKWMDEIGYIGILAFELFEDENGKLLINELAPRVHNSAHYSQNGLNFCQFELHLRAICDWPLPKVSPTATGFAMYNILGEEQESFKWTLPEGIHFHWYGKQESRLGRKMAHINCTAESADKALNQLKRARKEFKI